MPPTNRSSFIPKKSITRLKHVRSGKQYYLLGYVAYSIFFATLLAVGFVFFYTNYLDTRLSEKIAELDAQQVAFDQSDIVRVKELERQIKLAEHLFSLHTSTYAIFKELESIVVNGISLGGFQYERLDDSEATVSIAGGARRFDAVAFQRGLFSGAEILADAEFVGLSKKGEVKLDPEAAVVEVVDTDTDEVTSPVSFSIEDTILVSDIPFDISVYEDESQVRSVPVVPAAPTSATTTEVDSLEDETIESSAEES